MPLKHDVSIAVALVDAYAPGDEYICALTVRCYRLPTDIHCVQKLVDKYYGDRVYKVTSFSADWIRPSRRCTPYRGVEEGEL